jgi:Dolichyl-phosphate-mannose-protein mannosyltransferase
MSRRPIVRGNVYRRPVAVNSATAPSEPRALLRAARDVIARPAVIGWAIVAAGCALRIARYANDRSLWGDEARLALNIRDRSFTGLLHPLDYVQAAPTGFLLAEKAVVRLLGDSEYAVRLLPLLAGIASLTLFLPLARRLLTPVGALVAVALYATVEPLLYYSSETKQYSLDALATVLLLLLASPALLERSLSGRRAVGLLLAGVVAFWFSHPSIFVAGGVWLALALARVGMPARRAMSLAVLAVSWLAVFGLAYALVLRNAKGVSTALGLGSVDSTPGPVGVLRDGWHAFAFPVGFAYTATALAAAMTCLGAYSMLRRAAVPFAPLGLTVALTVLGAFAGRYPFYDRFVLFLVPIVLIVAAEGLDVLRRSTGPSVRAAWLIAFALLAAYPVGEAAGHLTSPPRHEEIKPVLKYMANAWRPGDRLYVSNVAQFALRYYVECNDCENLGPAGPGSLRGLVLDARGGRRALHSTRGLEAGYIDDGSPIETYVTDFSRFRGSPRVWFLFTSSWDDATARLVLGCMGHLIDAAVNTRAAAYLYDLSAPADAGRAECPGAP